MTDPALLDPRPHSRMTVRVRRDVFVDRAAFRLVGRRAGRNAGDHTERVREEVTAALALFAERGWSDDPASYHRTPPAPTSVRTRSARTGNVRYTSMTWLDGFECWPDEPGAARYAGYARNRIARAALLEHRSGDRPWLLCLHGFGMGSPGLDLRAFRALHLHRDLGLNLAFLTLPFHGDRRVTNDRLPQMPGPDALDTVHGLTHAAWDARQLLHVLQERSGQPVGVMGLSLGGGVAAVVASIDQPHAVVLLAPAVDLATLMADGAQRLPAASEEILELAARATPLLAPISPLALTPSVPPARRFIVAGTLDGFARPSTQAIALWRHWGEPKLHWYHGGHVSLFWARGVQAAIDGALREFGLAAR